MSLLLFPAVPAAPALTRTISAVDTDATKVPYWPITGALWISLGATANAPGSAITFRLLFFDCAGNLTGCMPTTTYTAAAGGADAGAAWIGTPTDPVPSNVCADRMAVKVDAVTGVWTFAAQAFFPPVTPPTSH